jgi:hypothetical protein
MSWDMVYCTEPTPKDKKVGFHVVDVEYTRLGFYKEFKSKEEYEMYIAQKNDLMMRIEGLQEQNRARTLLGFPVSDIEELEWLEDAKGFVNRWGENYVPENLRWLIDTVLWIHDLEPSIWRTLVPKKKIQRDNQSEVVDYCNARNNMVTYTLRLEKDEVVHGGPNVYRGHNKRTFRNIVCQDIREGSARKRLLIDGQMWVEEASLGGYKVAETDPATSKPAEESVEHLCSGDDEGVM